MATTFKRTAGNSFIRLALLSPFCSALRGRGHDPTPLLRAAGIAEDALSDQTLFVHADVIYQLLEDFADVAQEPYFGLRVGESFELSAWQPVQAALEGATTLGAFLSNFIQRVPKEANSVTHALTIDTTGAAYSVTRREPTAVASHQNTGFGCGLYVRLLRDATGTTWDPAQVVVESPYLDGVPKRYNGITLNRSDDSVLRLRFPSAWLFNPLQRRNFNPQKPTMAETPDVSMTLALKAIVSDRLDEARFDPAEIADLLGLSPARLKRALAKENTTLPREVKGLRIARAKALLQEGSLSITQIGVEVGYIDKAHFTRFFRSQTGITPSAYRTQVRTAAKRTD